MQHGSFRKKTDRPSYRISLLSSAVAHAAQQPRSPSLRGQLAKALVLPPFLYLLNWAIIVSAPIAHVSHSDSLPCLIVAKYTSRCLANKATSIIMQEAFDKYRNITDV